MEAFLDKGRLRSLLEHVPVRVVTHENTALVGAARLARRHRDGEGDDA